MSHPFIQEHISEQVYARPFWFGVIVLGVVFWLIAYGLAIVQGFRFKTYGIPLAAICCNVTWEAVSCFLRPPPISLWHYGSYLWFAVDLVIVYQVFRYGKAQQVIPEMRRWFYPVVVASLVLAFAGQDMLSAYIHDPYAYLSSYMINLTMSVLFIFMFFARRDEFAYAHGDLAYGIAWTKMLGTGVISCALVVFWPIFYPLKHELTFVWLILSSVFLVDVIYVALLIQARRLARAATSAAAVTPAAAS